jgi:hypothetical protein
MQLFRDRGRFPHVCRKALMNILAMALCCLVVMAAQAQQSPQLTQQEKTVGCKENADGSMTCPSRAAQIQMGHLKAAIQARGKSAPTSPPPSGAKP